MNVPLQPMLAVAAEPFDADDHLFELKWDGIRGLAAIESGTWRMWGRGGGDYQPRYPELDGLCRLPPGSVLDGELIRLTDGRADFPALLSRHQLTSRRKITEAARIQPVTYVVFDCLSYGGVSLRNRPLAERRKFLVELVGQEIPRVVCADGVTGAGRAYFKQAVAQGHEGVMAKPLAGRYFPGRRSAAWKKIKPARCLPAVIVGYTLGGGELASVLVAASWNGRLQAVARLTTGFTATERTAWPCRLKTLRRSQPVVSCHHRACWVEPRHFCRVRFLEWTAHGRLRGASYAGELPVATDQPDQSPTLSVLQESARP